MKKIKFEIIGNVLIIREKLDEELLRKFAREKMQKHLQIRTVVLQETKIEGIERKRQLKYLFGENSFETTHKEYNATYLLDLQETFFSPRMSFERQRIADLVEEGETIINFFAGVGPFSIAIAQRRKKNIIHSIEINETAYKYLKQNIIRNKCQESIITYLGNAFKIVPEQLNNQANRILLPLPLEADKALSVAYKALKNHQGIIHWQITEHVKSKEDLEKQILERIKRNLQEQDTSMKINLIRRIRWLSPRIAHIAVDLTFNRE